MNSITLTAADSICYPEHPDQYFAVPNDRIGTMLRPGEGVLRDSAETFSALKQAMPLQMTKDLSQKKALTYDEGKAPLAYVPWAAVDEMALVQAYGHFKYKDWNNYRKGMEVGRNLSCALRHIRDYMNGIDLDTESGRSHLGHAMCRIAFVLQNLHDGTAIDDRYKKQP